MTVIAGTRITECTLPGCGSIITLMTGIFISVEVVTAISGIIMKVAGITGTAFG